MKKFLVSIAFFLLTFVFVVSTPVFAQEPTAGPEARWVTDQEVTFVGKTAARSSNFLDWSLLNYNWADIARSDNPVQQFWVEIANIVYVIIALLVLISGFVMVISRGQNLSVMKFLKRLVFVLVLVTLSYAVVRFLYEVVDIVQGFFLRVDGQIITSADLLFLGFDYVDFIGFRKIGIQFDESAFMSLLLVRMTAITYYVMTGVLLIRKIILWFFLIVAPVFPILLFYSPVRNTAKIWLGEFFRWLLYAPLFAIFLHGLVVMWQSGTRVEPGIPLPFPQIAQELPGRTENIEYETAINIILAGPGQPPGLENSVNLNDTFALYVVALLMLWVVILLPFLLLQIFLDYLQSLSFENNAVIKNIVNRGYGFIGRGGGPSPTGPQGPPGQSGGTGLARQLPFMKKQGAGAVRPIQMSSYEPARTSVSVNVGQPAQVRSNVKETSQVLNLVNLSVPKMRDIAKYETSMISRDTTKTQETNRISSTLEKISNPSKVSSFSERNNFSKVREKLVQGKQKGDPLATSILNASNILNTTGSRLTQNIFNNQTTNISSSQSIVNQQTQIEEMLKNISNTTNISNPVTQQKYTEIKNQLVQAQAAGDPVATQILNASTEINNTNVTNTQKTGIVQKVLDTITKDKESKTATTIKTEILTAQKTTNQSARLAEFLQNISNTTTINNPVTQQKYTEIKNQLMQAQGTGDPVATQILNASTQISNTNITNEQKSDIVQKTLETITKEKDNPIAQKVVGEISAPEEVAATGSPVAPTVNLPAVNHVQQVSLEEYEEVKKMWTENYQTIEPPRNIDGELLDRKQWIKSDMDKINLAISYLSSIDPQRVNQGMEMVSNILPFLLIGGFSRSEVIAYLKAKYAAGKSVLEDTEKKEDEEDTLLSVDEKKEKEKDKTLEATRLDEQEQIRNDSNVSPGARPVKPPQSDTQENTQPGPNKPGEGK